MVGWSPLLKPDVFTPTGTFCFFIRPCNISVARKTKLGTKNNVENVKTTSPGLVVMGGDSCSEGLGFEPQQIFHKECLQPTNLDSLA